MSFHPLCKLQKKEMARILRQPLSPEVAARLANQEKEARMERLRAEAQADLDRATSVAAAEEAYRRELPDRIKREQQARFMRNAEKLS